MHAALGVEIRARAVFDWPTARQLSTTIGSRAIAD
jgi:hypothetical protein